MSLELTVYAFEVSLRIAIEEGIAAFVSVVGFIEPGIPALEGLQVVPDIVLPRRRVNIHPKGFLLSIEVGNRSRICTD